MKPLPLALVLALAACASTGSGPAAPTPYTADEIRAANPLGTVHVYSIRRAGAAPIVQTMRFVASSADAATIQSSMATPDGAVVAEPSVATTSWSDLRDHASFAERATARTREACSVEAGDFECWLYTVAEEDERGPSTSRYWFADRRPGPPVLLEIERDGRVVFRMELLETRRP